MTPAPETGSLVAGRYRLEEEAGEGGFAVAYRAVDSYTGNTVAVKYPNYEGSSNDPDVIEEYFLKEAETLERIERAGGNENLMSLLERGDDDGTPMLVVEYVDGYELDRAIDQTGPLENTDHVREIGIDLAAAMSFLHENEIVYRDLKPDNVMITEREGRPVPVLIDFNTATRFDSSGETTDTGTTILGPYKPAEVAEAASTDSRQGPWSDVYSIGKILLFLLKGTVPKKDGINPREFGVDCERYLASIVEKATQTHYEDRYRNATVMEQVLTAKDPTPPKEASLKYVQTGETYTIYPGDTVGRRYAEGPTPSIAIEDEQEYISTVQVQFEVGDGQWRLRDRSLNGTFVQTGDGWQRVLCKTGRERLHERDEDYTDRHGNIPPTTWDLTDSDLIALVHPSYSVTFEFHTT